ncbi:MAG: M28 family peptidase [Planctomycetota bacterium]|nr:M28 family peptidase [Planctomycetota bacterium]
MQRHSLTRIGPGGWRGPGRSLIAATLGGALLAGGCSSPPIPEGWEALGPRKGGHVGPPIDAGEAGTGRFVEAVLGSFEAPAAMALAEEFDAERRPPASEGYDRAVDRLIATLFGAGYGDEDAGADAGFLLEVISEPMAQPSWTPISAEIAVRGRGARGRTRRIVLAGFSEASDEQRTLLPEGVPSYAVSGAPVFALEDVVEGSVFVTDQPLGEVSLEAAERGAAAVVSSFQLPYAKDPTGSDRHFDAIFDGHVQPGATLPAMYVSLRTAESIQQAARAGGSLDLRSEVRTAVRELRTVVATIVGAERPEEVVYVVAHVSGSGANDNAAGAGAVVELARTIKRLISAGTIERPRRSIRFVFGDEAGAGGTALDHATDIPVAGIVADMIGASYARTGAICLLERGWDPGAVRPLSPDVHTPRGAGSVAGKDILPNGLSIVLRQALVDVGESVVASGETPWATREHPWEGGGDHDDFLDRGVAAALVWHFTDFAYSTSLDRMDHVDAEELRRTTCAIGAAALAVADMVPGDLRRHLDSLNLEAKLRMDAARAEGGEGLQDAWKDWFVGARFWLRALAGGEPLPDIDTLEPIGDE